MPVFDLTREFIGERFPGTVKREEIALTSAATHYTGVVYTLTHDGMSGTYIDFPGHIAETDDGTDAENCPLEQIWRVPASVIRLHRQSGSGAVTADDLERAWGGRPDTPAIIINALGDLNPHDIERRSVYLDDSGLDWLIALPCRLLVADIYESQALHGAFLKLFRAGITAICEPVNLGTLPRSVFLTALFPKIPGVRQLPCRLVADC